MAPVATYRLQFNRDFTFEQARQTLDYLCDLGISDCYASPIFRAGEHSTHGYDICSFKEIDPKLGGEDAFERFALGLRKLGMGLLLDMVPNHMAADSSNPWWWDVLKNGRSSPYASWFDINWECPDPDLAGKVLLPVLEDHCAKVVRAGKLKLLFEHQDPVIAYYDHRFPAGPASAASVIASPSVDQLEALLRQQHYRLAYWRRAPEQINYRRFFDVNELVSLRMELPEVFDAAHQRLLRLVQRGLVTGLRIDHPDGLWNPKEYCERLQAACAAAKGRPQPGPFYIVVEKILTGGEQLPLDWPVAGTTGYDFLNRVNGMFVDRRNEPEFDRLYHEFCGLPSRQFAQVAYESKKLVLQKSFVSELNALVRRLQELGTTTTSASDFSFARLRDTLTEIISAFPVYRTYITEETIEPSATDRKCIRDARRVAMAANTQIDRRALNFIESLLLLRTAAAENDSSRRAARKFAMRFQQFTAPAMAKGLEDTAFYKYNRLISLNEVGGDPGTFGIDLTAFHQSNIARAAKWPHSLLATATHDTKRGEDVRARLNVLSELPDEWRNAVSRWQVLNADKKTVTDGVPAPDSNDEYLFYQALVGSWPNETVGNGLLAAGGADTCSEPEMKLFRGRLTAYMLKAVKEAKTHSSWTDANPAYESAIVTFIQKLLATSEPNRFLQDFRPFQRRVAFFGRFNSLAQLVLKIMGPGVPDFYQGSELWDLSLVDPDNRRPVDFNLRRRLLKELKHKFGARQAPLQLGLLNNLLENSASGQIKMYVTWRALSCRVQNRALFESSSYEPLMAMGDQQEHICAFARAWQARAVIAVVPRLVSTLTGRVECAPLGTEVWRDTVVDLPRTFANKTCRNVFTGDTLPVNQSSGLPVAQVLARFPVAILESVG